MINAIATKFRQLITERKSPTGYFDRHHRKNKTRRSIALYNCIGLVSAILALLLITSPGLAQKPEPQQSLKLQQPLLVATRVIPPFVLSNNGELSGFSIDLWRSIATQIGIESKFIEYSSVPEVISAIKDNKVNLGIAAISITAEREQNFDFSLPIFAGGLQIMVRNLESKNSAFPNILQLFFSTSLLQVIGIALVLIVVAAHIIWLSERSHKEGMISESYFPGIFKACWWAAATLATQADEMPKGVLGRFIAIVWMFIGVLFVAYFTASATTSLTVQQLQGDIRSIDDLPGKVVATTAGSTAATYLREHHISVLEVPKIEEAYKALQTKKADAVVFDAPVLLFYAANEGKGKVEIVGSILREESYGIILPNNSPYRKPINQALLNLKENGTYQSLYDKWFDPKNS
ncbi:transporter substrate-binding domain-containing protein [Nostoc sp. UCD121]|uniref:transporter substrate-binding domain-containing protein n=1 Tax=unclassified Nostoc TaxID=2593658 RepID=UPI001626531C|nr:MULTISPECIES: transporter substrate-binding domain-containing protein [unclassified Nostoc]MBC1224502.1 transporter substrate-binding domain-containing protein [Nostoc sp. UCD120]MBC1274833.1 transporter substrate-binding domain-containing protein [Nostoc sp. UCD121]MBC1298033.1 transporter substrate-binding domain-containing protein [Nostoc sp. UCD122]